MRIRYLLGTLLLATPALAQSLEPPPAPAGIDVPDWALPQSANHKQVPPPADFRRASMTENTPIGIFEAQTEVGAPLAPGKASYDAAARTYTISAAGYNIWYGRDEFRYLWKKMSGDVSFAATVDWPDITEFHDRKVALMIRDSLDDNSRAITTAQHGNGLVHIAWRPETGAQMLDTEYRVTSKANPADRKWSTIHAARFGIEKRGDQFQLYVSWQGEKLHAEGAPVTYRTSGPFYVGIGFTSHLPANVLTAKVKDVVLENRAGAVR